MSKVVVIGAGASGIIAALKAVENNEVILIDSNDKCGKKILITGNGKCNYWNEDIDIKNYYASDIDILKKILVKKEEVLNYLDTLGIYPKIKNGYYYPASGLAASIREIFSKELEKSNIKVMYNTKVINVMKNADKFIIETTDDTITCDKVIIATGSKAFSKTGSDGFGYEIAKQFNHHINPVLPALTSLITNDSVKDWAGVRSEVKLSLYVNDVLEKEEFGEIQLTDDGISGICTFNISGLASKNLYAKNKVVAKINFLPCILDFYEFMEIRNKKIANRTIEELFESLLNYKLTNVLLKKCRINKDAYWRNLSELERQQLINNVCNFELNIIGTNSFDKSQVCTGGIPLNEITLNMESIYTKNLYFIGELLDVDGKCGGFNLAFAFITGYIVGENIK